MYNVSGLATGSHEAWPVLRWCFLRFRNRRAESIDFEFNTEGIIRFSNCRAAKDRAEPVFHGRKLFQFELLSGFVVMIEAINPWSYGNISDCKLITDDILLVSQLLLQDSQQASSLVCVSLDGVGNLFWSIVKEMTKLTEHGSQSRHLPEQPLDCRSTRCRVAWNQLSSLFSKIEQDSSRFEESKRLTVCKGTTLGKVSKCHVTKRLGNVLGPFGSTIAGILLLGLILRKSGANCSPFIMLMMWFS